MQTVSSRFSRQRGVTLIELMIIAVIIGILASVAFPAFRENAMRSARSDARTALQDALARQEQFFLDNKTYANTLAAINMISTSENGYYAIAIDPATVACPIARCYSMRATPLGTQANDGDCTALIVNSTGNKTATGANPGSCW